MRIETNLILGALEAAAYAMSRDETRPHLHGVHLVSEHEGRLSIVATDGHRLVLGEVTAVGHFPESGCLIDAPAVKRLISTLKAHTKTAVKPSRKDPARPTWVDLDVGIKALAVGLVSSDGDNVGSVTLPLCDEHFPPFRKVIPSYATGEASSLFRISPVLLSEVLQGATKLQKRVGTPRPVYFYAPPEPLDPVVLTSSTEGAELTIVVMPMRV